MLQDHFRNKTGDFLMLKRTDFIIVIMKPVISVWYLKSCWDVSRLTGIPGGEWGAEPWLMQLYLM